MRLIESFKNRKFILLNVFLGLYIGINFIGGERGLISYLDKKKFYKELLEKETLLNENLKNLEHKIYLLKKNDSDYLDILLREKFRYGTQNEIIIKLK